MIIKYGDLFDTDAPYIGHGVNVYGVMGKGIAKEFKSRYPEMFNSYRQACIDNYNRAGEGELQPGGMHWYKYPGTKLIFNLASQSRPGRYAKESWLTMSLFRSASKAHFVKDEVEARIAIPAVGCGIGGLHIDALERSIGVVEDYFCNEVQFELWLQSPHRETPLTSSEYI